jgi:hypothetical protein
VHAIDDRDRCLRVLGLVLQAYEARDAEAFDCVSVIVEELGRDGDVVAAVGRGQRVEQRLGKARHRIEEAAVARLGRELLERACECRAIAAVEQAQTHTRAVVEHAVGDIALIDRARGVARHARRVQAQRT